MVKTKPGLMDRLKEAGYSSYRLRKEKLMGEATMTQIRNQKAISGEALNLLCKLLNCQPGDILEYVPDNEDENSSRLSAFKLNLEEQEKRQLEDRKRMYESIGKERIIRIKEKEESDFADLWNENIKRSMNRSPEFVPDAEDKNESD